MFSMYFDTIQAIVQDIFASRMQATRDSAVLSSESSIKYRISLVMAAQSSGRNLLPGISRVLETKKSSNFRLLSRRSLVAERKGRRNECGGKIDNGIRETSCVCGPKREGREAAEITLHLFIVKRRNQTAKTLRCGGQ